MACCAQIWVTLFSLIAVTTVIAEYKQLDLQSLIGVGISEYKQLDLQSLIGDDFKNALKVGECQNLILAQRTVGSSLYGDGATVCNKNGDIAIRSFLSITPKCSTIVKPSTETWPFCENCFPKPRPSPIDIIPSLATDVKLPKLEFFSNFSQDVDYVIKNSGQTVRMYMRSNPGERPYIQGGPLKTTFTFEQFHCHWGNSDNCSSEHSINGECFSTEGHIVHINSKYRTFEAAMDEPDGICVVAFFAEVVAESNPLLQPLIEVLPQVAQSGQEITVRGRHIFDWFAGLQCKNRLYFTYAGSQTITPYAESVIYIIFPEPLTLSSQQLVAFRQLQLLDENGQPTHQNRRELQPFHHRPLLSVDNFENYQKC